MAWCWWGLEPFGGVVHVAACRQHSRARRESFSSAVLATLYALHALYSLHFNPPTANKLWKKVPVPSAHRHLAVRWLSNAGMQIHLLVMRNNNTGTGSGWPGIYWRECAADRAARCSLSLFCFFRFPPPNPSSLPRPSDRPPLTPRAAVDSCLCLAPIA